MKLVFVAGEFTWIWKLGIEGFGLVPDVCSDLEELEIRVWRFEEIEFKAKPFWEFGGFCVGVWGEARDTAGEKRSHGYVVWKGGGNEEVKTVFVFYFELKLESLETFSVISDFVAIRFRE